MEPTKPNQQPQPSSPEPLKPAQVAGAEAVPVVAADSAATGSQAAPAATPTSPAVAAPATTASTPPASATPTPAQADDVDVIEKEWVDAAKAMEEKTAGDPHAEEEGFEDLQVDYIHKRFGKDIKKPTDS